MNILNESNFLGILRELAAAEIEFILVGSVSAVLQGAPLVTFDVDIVHSRTPDNVRKLLVVLEKLEARYRIRPDLSPSESHLVSRGHQLLSTKMGPLDLLGAIAQGEYEDLFPMSKIQELEPGLRVRVLNLAAYLREKEARPDPKDRAAAEILRRLLSERGEI